MRMRTLLLSAFLVGCSNDGRSTTEIRQAAIERARADFKLPANTPLEATVWVGADYEDEPSLCGTVSSTTGTMPPQRFMASAQPFRWLVFENAHAKMTISQPDKFPEWTRYCTGEAART